MFRFEDRTESLSPLIRDWENDRLSRERLKHRNFDYLSVFSMLSEWQENGPQPLSEVYRTCVSLGKVDASLAWIAGVSNSAWSMLGNMPESTVRAIDYPIASMVLGRPGTAAFNEKKDTATVTGEWRYCSGFEQAGGFIGLVKENKPDGEVFVALMPAEELELAKPWNAIGLKGTGSHTVRANNVPIARESMVPYADILSGRLATSSPPSYRSLFTGVLMNCLTGSIVGATLHLFDLAVEQAANIGISGSSYSLGKDSGAVRTVIGGLSSRLEGIYEFGAGGAAFVDEVAYGNEGLWTTSNRALLRARASSVMQQCREVADELLWIMGSSALTEDNPAASIWKDIHVGALHGGFSKHIPQEAVGLDMFNENPLNLTKML